MSADADVAKGMIDRWNAQSLTSTVTGGIHSGRLVAPTLPYARLVVTKDKAREVLTGDEYIDYRLATITIHGVGKKAVADIVTTVLAAFKDGAIFAVPNSTLMRCEPLDHEIEDEQEEKSGDDVQKATLPFRIWTTRTAGT